jgi:hypothetical protein
MRCGKQTVMILKESPSGLAATYVMSSIWPNKCCSMSLSGTVPACFHYSSSVL